MAGEPFPVAAKRELGDVQLRANLGRATRTIRDKRARVVAEVPDWVVKEVEALTAPQKDYLIEAFGEEFYKNTR